MSQERYRAWISYDGSRYAGWQSQPDAHTIQDEIEDCLSKLYAGPIKIVGCGRTDAGVHAQRYAFHFDGVDDRYSADELRYKLNKMLSDAIAVHVIELADASFHARFDAISRSYTYRIHFDKDPFIRGYSLYYPYPDRIDIALLQDFSQLLLESEDFDTFCKVNTDVKTKKCAISHARWHMVGEELHFDITSDRFLRGMIRLIVGTGLNLSRGKISIEDIIKALKSRSQLYLSWSVPPQGLILHSIQYPDTI